MFRAAILTILVILLIVAILSKDAPREATKDQVPEYFPYEVLTVPGKQAYSEWQRLVDESQATPIIIGSNDDLLRVFEPFSPEFGATDNRYVTMQYAWGLSHPESLKKMWEAEWADILEQDRASGEDSLFSDIELEDEEPIGIWPDAPEENPGLLSLNDYQTGNVLAQAHIVLIPTKHAARAPAFLRFGGWNSNPPPAYHVAALQSWFERYGAVPVLMTGDVIELRVSRRPETKEEALALAREHFLMSEDIVYQGVGSISNLAASLMVSDWWYFWWD